MICFGIVFSPWEGDFAVGGWKSYAGRGDRVLRLVKTPSGDESTLRRRNLGVLWRKLLISSPLMRGSRGRLVRMGNMGRTDDVGSVGATGCTEDLGHADNLVRVDALGHADNLTYMNNPRHIDNLTTRDT